MKTEEVANKLVSHCRVFKFDDAIAELYSPKIISIEREGAPNPRVEGIENVIKKSQEFAAGIEEYHGLTVSEPLVAGNFFTVKMEMDVTFKGMGRVPMNEICLYEVKDGKIVYEEFFYDVQQQ